MTPPETARQPETDGPTWALFLALVCSNAMISYASLPLSVKGLIFLLGIVLPFYCFLRQPPPIWNNSFEFTVPSYSFALLAILVIITRLMFLTSYEGFPGGDEGLHGFLAQGLIPKWNWTFFYTCAEHPPLLIWLIALLLRWTNAPLFSIWLVPAACSIFGWFLLTAAARRILSPNHAVLFSFLLALSFWPLYSSRFCHQGPLLAPFLGVLLYSMAKADQTAGRQRIFWTFASGFTAGLGLLTFTAWLVVLPITCAFWLWRSWMRRQDQPPVPALTAFIAGLLLGSAPFILAVFREGYGQHLYSVSTLGSWSQETQKHLVGLSYLTALFWGGLVSSGAYGAPAGGMLNPILSAACLVGLSVSFRRIFEARFFWLLAALIFSILPGILSTDYVEMFRIVLVQPLLLVLTAIGLLGMASTFNKPKSIWFLCIVLALSTATDLTLFSFPLFRNNAPILQGGGPLAYRILSQQAQQDGPGYVLTDFSPLEHNHALSATTFGFNAAVNPRFSNFQPKWVGLTTQEDFCPYLQAQYPEGRWCVVQGGPGDPALTVGILPITETNRAKMERWVSVHRFFHEQQLLVENVFASRKKYSAAVEHLQRGATLVSGDRFLETAYGEWAAQYFLDPQQKGNIEHLKHAIQAGYPAPHLVKKLIALLLENGDRAEAEQFQKTYRPASK